MPATIDSAQTRRPTGMELYRSRVEADDVPPTIGSAPTLRHLLPQDELYRSRIAEDDPPTLASAPLPRRARDF